MNIGFGKASLWGSWSTTRPLVDEIEVRAMVVRAARQVMAVVMSADLCSMLPQTCARLRHAIADALHVSSSRVGVFCTQNHGTPMEEDGVYRQDDLRRAFVEAAIRASDSAVSAHMGYVCAKPPPRRVVNRRKHFGDLGAFSFFYGFETDGHGQAGCTHLLEAALRSLSDGGETIIRQAELKTSPPGFTTNARLPSVQGHPQMEDATDPLAQALFFRDATGRPIGSLARWAAHPVTANTIHGGHSGDYPVYLRRHLEQTFGGQALFLTGPCGDQAPAVDIKSVELARQTGVYIGELLLKQLDHAHWSPVQSAAAASEEINLPLSSDFPESILKPIEKLTEARRQLAELRKTQAPLADVKHCLERIERLGYFVDGRFERWCGVSDSDCRRGHIRHPLFALALNQLALIGLPGEPYGSYSCDIRNALSEAPVIVAEQGNGYLNYIPSEAEYFQGGYESASAILAPEAQPVILASAVRLVRSCLSHDKQPSMAGGSIKKSCLQ